MNPKQSSTQFRILLENNSRGRKSWGVRLKSKQNFVPNGWQFYQAETNWKLPNPWLSFEECVKQIIAHRQANPRFNLATDFVAVATEFENYTIARLLSTPGGRDYILEDGGGGPSGSFHNRQRLPGRLAAAAVGASNVIAGLGALKDWLGAGLKPVTPELASQRAAICAVCPQNKPIGNLLETAGALGVRLVEAKNDMKLSTPDDEKLGQCAACLCLLKLKVWAPLEHILANQTEDVASKLDLSCWIVHRDQPIPA